MTSHGFKALAVMFDTHTLVITASRLSHCDDKINSLIVKWDGEDVNIPTDILLWLTKDAFSTRFGGLSSAEPKLVKAEINMSVYEQAASTAKLFATPLHGFPKVAVDTPILQLLDPMQACPS